MRLNSVSPSLDTSEIMKSILQKGKEEVGVRGVLEYSFNDLEGMNR